MSGRSGLIAAAAIALLGAAIALAAWPTGGGAPTAAAQEPQPTAPLILSDREVLIGAYVANIQAVVPETNSFLADVYVWMRWTDESINPMESMEFVNLFEAWQLMSWSAPDQPERLPDGSLYAMTHYQGAFNSVLTLRNFPFAEHSLEIQMEDLELEAQDFRYVTDPQSIAIDPLISIPGYRIGDPSITITDYAYPTTFGYLDTTASEVYSRAVVSIPVARPEITNVLKYLVPILLVMIAAGLIFQVPPGLIEGRIGLAITALLTLVAMQWTATDSLPINAYLTMLDLLYLISLGFVLASLVQAMRISWIARDRDEAEAIHLDKRAIKVFYVAYGVVVALVIGGYLLL